MPRRVVAHVCGHLFVHQVADFGDGSREMQDMERWHQWLWSQPCLNCLRPTDLPAVSADLDADQLAQAALVTVPPPSRRKRTERSRRNANSLVFPSRFVRTLKPIFENARLTVEQAQALEYLFLRPDKSASYVDLANATETTASVAVEMVTAMTKRGFVRRHGDGRGVALDYAAFWLRGDYPEWSAWLAAAARQP